MAMIESALPPRYTERDTIAHGGMADVFRASDETLGRVVAIKVLAERWARNKEFRARFLREARTAASLSGERFVIAIYDVGETVDGLPYIVMEYAPGGTVADRLREGRPEAGTGGQMAGTGCFGARYRACPRHRAPRRQARQLSAHGRRHRARLGLRHRASGGIRHADRGGDCAGLRGVHGARAGSGRAEHCRDRPLRARLRRLRDVYRQETLRAREHDGRGGGPRQRAAANGARRRPAVAAGTRSRLPTRAREASP